MKRKIGFLKSLVVFIFSTAIFSFIWYLRQYLVLGNPMFPFFTDIFGTGGLAPEVLRALSESSIRDMHGMRAGIPEFLSLPWRLTMFPQRFGGEQLGPVFLGFIPGICLIKKADTTIKVLSLIIFMYVLFWFFQYQHLRFLLPVAPILSIITAYVIVGIGRSNGPFFKATIGVFTVYLMFCFLLLLYHNAEAAMTVLGVEGREGYLKRHERSYDLSEYINNDLPEGAKVLIVGENNTFYIERPYSRELYYWIYEGYDKKCAGAREVFEFFEKEGFTHMVFASRQEEAALSGSGGLRLIDLLKREDFTEMYLDRLKEVTPDSENSRGTTYVIYGFKPHADKTNTKI